MMSVLSHLHSALFSGKPELIQTSTTVWPPLLVSKLCSMCGRYYFFLDLFKCDLGRDEAPHLYEYCLENIGTFLHYSISSTFHAARTLLKSCEIIQVERTVYFIPPSIDCFLIHFLLYFYFSFRHRIGDSIKQINKKTVSRCKPTKT